MEMYVVDTNFFFNLEIKSGFGDNPKAIIIRFTEIARKLKAEKKAEFFMPPRIIEEMMTFLDINEQHVKDFLAIITPKSPNVANVSFPAAVFYQLVEEIRDRSYKGLRIAEESVEAGAQRVIGKTDLPRIEYQKTIGEVVTKLRERYRQATRFNFLDSVADLDLIVLSKELDAFLVTSDEGVIRWGRTFGIKEVGAPLLLSRLLGLLA